MRTEPPLRRLAFSPAIVERVAPLIGPSLQLFGDQALHTPARDGGAIYWHQDNAYWKCAPARVVTCWLTLDEVDVENGAMRVIPGSNRVAVAHRRATDGSSLLDGGARVDDAQAVTIELPPGGAMLHHCLTLHASGANRTECERRAFAFHHMAPGTTTPDAGTMPVSFRYPLVRLGG